MACANETATALEPHADVDVELVLPSARVRPPTTIDVRLGTKSFAAGFGPYPWTTPPKLTLFSATVPKGYVELLIIVYFASAHYHHPAIGRYLLPIKADHSTVQVVLWRALPRLPDAAPDAPEDVQADLSVSLNGAEVLPEDFIPWETLNPW